jgi:sec-independent protein translocase protein TatC
LAKDPEKRAELVEHLAELRSRLVACVLFVAIGMAVAWFAYDWIFAILTRPMTAILREIGSKFLLTGFPEAFMIRMQICLVSGLIIMSPFVTWQIWAFVAPGLTANEKKPLKWIAPLSIVLFLSGVILCYLIMPAAFKWFAGYVPRGAELRPSVQASVLFTVKMLFAFGVVFQLPVVLMLLAMVGIVDSRMLRANWRPAMVAVSVVAAIATPSNDAFSMLCMAIPVAGLYLFSIFLVWLVEGERRFSGVFGSWLGKLFSRRRARV